MENQKEIYKLEFTNEDGIKVEYEVLLTFKSEKYNKVFYIMTDNSTDENNKLNTYAFYTNNIEYSYEEVNSDDTFYSVVDDEELKLVYDVFDKVKKEL